MNTVLQATKGLSTQINLKFFPVPDGTSAGKDYCDHGMFSKEICTCELHEACASHAAGCSGSSGCSGEAAENLIKFLSCYVKGQTPTEDSCKPANKDSCIVSSGIDSKAMAACLADKSTLHAVELAAMKECNKVQGQSPVFPYSTFNGKFQNQGEGAAAVKKALCKAGAKAACSGSLIV